MTSHVGEVLVSLWGWLQIGVGLVCVYLLHRGLRVRRLDSHPHCRRCLYDLTGQAMDSRRCPECGLDVMAVGNVVRGRTRREWRWVGWALVVVLVAVGADRFVLPRAMEANGRWARLSQAMATGDSTAAAALLQQDPGLLDRPEEVSYLLALAIRSRDDAAVTMLLNDPRVEARVNTAGDFGEVPLREALRGGTLTMVSALIEAGAQVNSKDKDGGTPLIYAAQFNPSSELIAALVKAGADVNARDAYGVTPLMILAMDHPNLEVITAPVNAGADVNAKNKDGGTPLMFAARSSPSPEVITTLMKAGAGVNAKNKDGRTPLMFAAAKNPNPEVIADLVKGGVDVNAKGMNGVTPLMIAARDNPNPAVIAALVKAGAEVNAKDKYGWAPLMYAQQNHRPNMMDALVEAGAAGSK